MIDVQAVAPYGQLLSDNVIRETLHKGLAGKFTGARVLVLIPDHTRTVPLPQLFRYLVEILHDAHQLDFMVALGTHPPLDEGHLDKLVGNWPIAKDAQVKEAFYPELQAALLGEKSAAEALAEAEKKVNRVLTRR